MYFVNVIGPLKAIFSCISGFQTNIQLVVSTQSEVCCSKMLEHVLSKLKTELEPLGFELSPFLVGWYNELVSVKLHLDAPSSDCLAICLISSPMMFEASFLPLLFSWFEKEDGQSLEDVLRNLKSKETRKTSLPGLNDPLDWSVFIRVNAALKRLREDNNLLLTETESLALGTARFVPDYVVRPVSRLPLIHVQCAGHVSGLAYYHKACIKVKDLSKEYGCSLHPKYGGWFGFRGVIVFPDIRCPELPRPITRSPLLPGLPPFDTEALQTLITEYRERWRDNRWRDIGVDEQTVCRYSETARSFFNTPPSSRAQWVERLIQMSRCRTCPVLSRSSSPATQDHLTLKHQV
ncbi:Methylmalonic aciduria homocystinuria type C protein [Fasciola hepatica]|uniref:Cyanocobalamin reductase (cyanide-eliminating) n=1 Tax=Fasciola hepatica TaxID=6192 RepID=A0A4E0S154_FASHE|nr:Methylmalonic aciduria homocystinuria type C protein [Fasciola hepatica]